jgi:uncharacterized protein (TIGR02996 family)
MWLDGGGEIQPRSPLHNTPGEEQVPRYELVDGKSNKFWEINLAGTSFTTQYGRIGSKGQKTLKEHDSAEKAAKEYEKLIAAKVKKGYKLVGGADEPPAKKETPKATKKAAKKKATKKKAAGKAEAEVVPAVVEEGWLRLEFVEGTSNKFWEIRREDSVVLTRYGRIGSDGKVTRKELSGGAAGRKEYDKLLASKLKKGYVQVGGGPAGAQPAVKHAVNEELEAAILADPDDDEACMVYADWLQTQGDPRGELAAVQQQLLRQPKSAKLKNQEAKLLEQHSAHLLGKLADVLDMVQDIEWHMGFIRSATVKNVHERSDLFDEPEREMIAVEEVLGWLLDHPSGRFLRDLTVGIVDFEDNGYGGVAQALGKRRLPAMRTLFLGDFIYEETELNWSHAGNIEPLYKAVPNLQSLTVRSGSMTLGKINLPELREFVTITGGMGDEATRSICTARWPKLERLSLQFGRRYESATTDVKEIRPLLDAKGLPNLKHLGITNAEFTDAVCAELPRSKVLPQLVELDLKMGTMGEAGARAIIDNAEKFKHLELLDVQDNYLDGLWPELRGVCAKVVFGDQRGPADTEPGDRYASAIE